MKINFFLVIVAMFVMLPLLTACSETSKEVEVSTFYYRYMDHQKEEIREYWASDIEVAYEIRYYFVIGNHYSYEYHMKDGTIITSSEELHNRTKQ